MCEVAAGNSRRAKLTYQALPGVAAASGGLCVCVAVRVVRQEVLVGDSLCVIRGAFGAVPQKCAHHDQQAVGSTEAPAGVDWRLITCSRCCWCSEMAWTLRQLSAVAVFEGSAVCMCTQFSVGLVFVQVDWPHSLLVVHTPGVWACGLLVARTLRLRGPFASQGAVVVGVGEVVVL